MHANGGNHKPDEDRNEPEGRKEEAPPPGPSFWEEVRRHAVLGVAGAGGPLLVVFVDWWLRIVEMQPGEPVRDGDRQAAGIVA
ncbi:hypothetical protein [Streptomyces goshikiensis]|uniref:hypothetical protein n=1 Tax=Streptomyces goshikiensis TaxID=1942 RepID=UPI0033190DDA